MRPRRTGASPQLCRRTRRGRDSMLACALREAMAPRAASTGSAVRVAGPGERPGVRAEQGDVLQPHIDALVRGSAVAVGAVLLVTVGGVQVDVVAVQRERRLPVGA